MLTATAAVSARWTGRSLGPKQGRVPAGRTPSYAGPRITMADVGTPRRSDQAREDAERLYGVRDVGQVTSAAPWRAGPPPPDIAALSGCRCVAGDIGGKRNGLQAGQRPGDRRYVSPLSWACAAGVLIPGAERGQGPERVCVSAGQGLALSRFEDSQGFDFLPVEQCPRQIRTCAHGSGGDCCARP